MTPSPTPIDQRVSRRLQRLEGYFEARELGEVFDAPLDTILGPHDVLEPNLLVVTDATHAWSVEQIVACWTEL